MLLWASKFATGKIECTLENGKANTFGGNIYLAGDGTLFYELTDFRHETKLNPIWSNDSVDNFFTITKEIDTE